MTPLCHLYLHNLCLGCLLRHRRGAALLRHEEMGRQWKVPGALARVETYGFIKRDLDKKTTSAGEPLCVSDCRNEGEAQEGVQRSWRRPGNDVMVIKILHIKLICSTQSFVVCRSDTDTQQH